MMENAKPIAAYWLTVLLEQKTLEFSDLPVAIQNAQFSYVLRGVEDDSVIHDPEKVVSLHRQSAVLG